MSNINGPLISIIVPVYKVEKYLCKCVDSILNQTFQEYELILVDDGSTDNCPAICDGYAAKDRRIKAIHKGNGGAWDARNVGMHTAVGKYLLFIDGDDFIADGSLAGVAKTLEEDGETDVILLNAVYYYDDGTMKCFDGVFKKDRLYNKSHMEALSFLVSMSGFNTSVCLKLIKRELLISNNIFFNEIVWGEDTDFSMKLYLYAETYNYCGSYIYHYRKERDGSCTYSFTEKNFSDLLYMISKWIREAKENPEYYKFSEAIYTLFAFQYCMLISGFHKISLPAQKELRKEAEKYAWLLKKTKDKRVSFVRIFYTLFGMRLTSIALGFYEKLRGF